MMDAIVRLIPATEELVPLLSILAISAEQRAHLSTPDLGAFVAEAHLHPAFTVYGVEASGKIVGLISTGLLPEDRTSAWIPLMAIDVAEQGLGYGRATLEAAIAIATGELAARRLGLSFHPDNTRAAALYRSAGFVEEVASNDAGERVAWLSLPTS